MKKTSVATVCFSSTSINQFEDIVGIITSGRRDILRVFATLCNEKKNLMVIKKLSQKIILNYFYDTSR
jgi:hypothetical protein